jgi:hypothetical protein
MKRTDLIELLQQPTETLAVEIKRWLSPDDPIEAAKIARSNSSGHGAARPSEMENEQPRRLVSSDPDKNEEDRASRNCAPARNQKNKTGNRWAASALLAMSAQGRLSPRNLKSRRFSVSSATRTLLQASRVEWEDCSKD